LEREQFWLDLLKPEYNVCTIAGNTQGITLSAETREKISQAHRGKRLSPETRKLMSEKRAENNI